MIQDDFVLTYNFSCREIKAFADFFRERQNMIPRELFAFAKSAQEKAYECMTIDEVEKSVKNEK
ncbi:MAG: hypothetical protein IJR40_07520 [Treponema sp.]|nr:hypothetical protein [Treponema sp.]MBQ7620586.1 hypothetical protein [Treponema sp.]MBQ9627007.1 hypothetical protein [Treponema sp.]